MKYNSSNGVGLGGLVFIVFLILKLIPGTVVYHWSWWWVTSPIWIPLLLSLALLTIIGLVWGFIKFAKWAYRKD